MFPFSYQGGGVIEKGGQNTCFLFFFIHTIKKEEVHKHIYTHTHIYYTLYKKKTLILKVDMFQGK
jgi:hypothetical protein